MQCIAIEGLYVAVVDGDLLKTAEVDLQITQKDI